MKNSPRGPVTVVPLLVAVRGSDDLDVTTVDLASLALGENAAGAVWATFWDQDGDGHDDLLAFFRPRETGVAPGDTELCLSGHDMNGVALQGCDEIQTEMPQMPWWLRFLSRFF